LGRASRGPPTFWLSWAAAISGLPTFLGDVNFFFLYIAIMTGEKSLKPILRIIIIQIIIIIIIIIISYNKLRLNVPRMPQMAV